MHKKVKPAKKWCKNGKFWSFIDEISGNFSQNYFLMGRQWHFLYYQLDA